MLKALMMLALLGQEANDIYDVQDEVKMSLRKVADVSSVKIGGVAKERHFIVTVASEDDKRAILRRTGGKAHGYRIFVRVCRHSTKKRVSERITTPTESRSTTQSTPMSHSRTDAPDAETA